MSIVLEIENPKVRKIRDITGAESDVEAIEVALERFVSDYEVKPSKNGKSDLPDTFWDDLFSSPRIDSTYVIDAVEKEREDRF